MEISFTHNQNLSLIMRSERGFFRRCSFSLKSQAFDTGNSIHQALGRLHFESTGCDNSPAKGFLIQWKLVSDRRGEREERNGKMSLNWSGKRETRQNTIAAVHQSLVIVWDEAAKSPSYRCYRCTGINAGFHKYIKPWWTKPMWPHLYSYPFYLIANSY